MADDQNELGAAERDALDGWTPLAPPAGFADRVLAARMAAEAAPVRARRWPLVAAVTGTLAAAAATLLIVTHAAAIDHTAAGALAPTTARTTARVGDRAIAVAEPQSTLDWHVDASGAATVEQRAGNVFYRVDHGGPFVVQTPAGTVRVTGTCFRIQVLTEDPMPLSKTAAILVSGALGAAVATAVVVTVYEGRVSAETKTAHTEIPAGSHVTLDTGGNLVAGADPAPMGRGKPVIVMRTPDGPAPLDPTSATREQLVAYTQTQAAELAKLRTRVAELEQQPHEPGDGTGDGRPWHDPSPDTLKAWAKECRIQADEPGFDRWQPKSSIDANNPMGLEPSELAAYNAALTEVQDKWKAFVRALYIEATGDTTGADTLSIEAMRNEVMLKGTDAQGVIEQRISAEKAGLAPPPVDLTKLSPAERMMREYVNLGDETEAALAKRLGPDRAAALRGDGWGARSRMAGCPATGNPGPGDSD